MFKVISKFFSILELSQKKKLVILLFLSFIAAFLEMLGLSLFIPIIASFNSFDFQSNIFTNNYLVSFFYDFSKFFENKIFYFLIILGFFISFKTIILIYFSKISSKFSSNLYQNISSRIFKNYLYQDYNFYLSRSSSQLIQNVTNEITILITRFFGSFIILVNEILIFLLISILLILVSSIAFVVILFLFVFFLIIFIFITKKFLKVWSFKKQNHQIASIKYVQEGIRNIKDLKVYGLEEKFFDYFNYELKNVAKIDENVNLLSLIPKYYIEFISIAIFILIYWILYLLDFSNQKIIIIVCVFAAAAIKLLPSIYRILNTIIQIKYSTSTIETVYKEINLKNNYKKNKLLSQKKNIIVKNNLVIKNFYFKYKNSNEYLFRNINLRIPLKKIIAIVGDSGSGKTTFVDIILGLIKPTKGSILINNINIYKNLKSWRDNISYVQQFSYFTQDSIKNNITIASKEKMIDIDRVNYCLNIVGLTSFINGLPRKINTQLSELANNLSGGQKQRLSIARALYTDPNILILDEATNSLDEIAEINILKKIKSLFKNKTLFIVTHKRTLLKYCNLIVDVNNNRVKIIKN